MRSWQDFDILNLAILPMFLFSATFFPLSTYPDWLEWVIRATPLYNGVELLRALTTGTVGRAQLVNVAYLSRRSASSARGSRAGGSRSCCSRRRKFSAAVVSFCT